MAVVVTILVVVVAIYLAALLALFLMQKAKVFPGSAVKSVLPESSVADRSQIVKIDCSAGLLLSWYIPAERTDGQTIIYFHGNKGTIADRVERVLPYLAIGYGVLLVGYPGYADNPGRPSEKLFYETGRANLDFLNSQGISPEQLILFGESLGTAVAVQMATERQARALILEAPFASVHHSAWARYPFLAFNLLIRDKFASIDKIARVHMPLLIIHGERDQTTHVRFGKMLFARANEPKLGVFPPNAGHNDLMQHGMPDAVCAFLEGVR